MSAFWLIGIAIDVVALAALVWWAVRQWKKPCRRAVARAGPRRARERPAADLTPPRTPPPT
ncbi:MAG: hypothetical protein U1E86_11710 [Burkholderiaceae bacterium]